MTISTTLAFSARGGAGAGAGAGGVEWVAVGGVWGETFGI